VRIESEEITEGLLGGDCAGDWIIFRNSLLEKDIQGFTCAAAEIGKKLQIVEKVTAEGFRDAEYGPTLRSRHGVDSEGGITPRNRNDKLPAHRTLAALVQRKNDPGPANSFNLLLSAMLCGADKTLFIRTRRQT
jgi:hypothetical protein